MYISIAISIIAISIQSVCQSEVKRTRRINIKIKYTKCQKHLNIMFVSMCIGLCDTECLSTECSLCFLRCSIIAISSLMDKSRVECLIPIFNISSSNTPLFRIRTESKPVTATHHHHCRRLRRHRESKVRIL